MVVKEALIPGPMWLDRQLQAKITLRRNRTTYSEFWDNWTIDCCYTAERALSGRLKKTPVFDVIEAIMKKHHDSLCSRAVACGGDSAGSAKYWTKEAAEELYSWLVPIWTSAATDLPTQWSQKDIESLGEDL